MNRSEILSKGLKNWLEFSWISEIVIVDWSSKIPFEYDHPKVKVIRVENEKYWIQTQAYNLAAEFASGEILMKCDVDYRLDSKIESVLNIIPGEFCRGNWLAAKTENEKSINGFCLLYKSDFNSVGGYNEDLITYGFDDGDFYKRLRDNGYKEILLSCENGIYHVPHSSDLKTVNSIKPDLPAGESNESNRQFILENESWSPNSQKSKWKIILERI
jgi:hypothetical protein